MQPFAGVKGEDLRSIGTIVTAVYGYRTKTLRPLSVPNNRDCNRRWCDAGHLFNTLYARAPRAGVAVMGVTGSSLSSGFPAQGVARHYGNHCLVSTHGLPSKRAKRRRLLSLTAIHELGHVFGITGHCDLAACVMAPYLSDMRQVGFCGRCTSRIRRRGYAVKGGHFLRWPRNLKRRRRAPKKTPTRETRQFLELLASCGVDCQIRNLHRMPQVKTWKLKRGEPRPIEPLPATTSR